MTARAGRILRGGIIALAFACPFLAHYALATGQGFLGRSDRVRTIARRGFHPAPGRGGPLRWLVLAGGAVAFASSIPGCAAGSRGDDRRHARRIHGSLLAWFASSLRPGREALVTSLARQVRGSLEPDVAAYTRNVTRAWCVFFAAAWRVRAAAGLRADRDLVLDVNILDLPLVGLTCSSANMPFGFVASGTGNPQPSPKPSRRSASGRQVRHEERPASGEAPGRGGQITLVAEPPRPCRDRSSRARGGGTDRQAGSLGVGPGRNRCNSRRDGGPRHAPAEPAARPQPQPPPWDQRRAARYCTHVRRRADPLVTPRVLDILDAHGAKASFFCIGERVEAEPALTREILRRGHSVGNHSHSHPLGFALSLAGGFARELGAAREAIEKATGTSRSSSALRWGFAIPARLRRASRRPSIRLLDAAGLRRRRRQCRCCPRPADARIGGRRHPVAA